MMELKLALLSEKFMVCQLPPDFSIPDWAQGTALLSITRTDDELSIVCEEHFVPDGVKCEPEWRAIKVVGPLDFSLVGILANLSRTLADAGVSIFAISTYDTDYILIKNNQLDTATHALRHAGYTVDS